jgi:DtxR family manganese transport transcriptional regulator
VADKAGHGERADSDRFVRTRAAHEDETAEDYVEAVDTLITQTGEARVRDLARLMGVSHVTVSRIIARLAKPEPGLVETAPYRPITLTAKGKRLAARVRERHRIVADFLRAIGVPDRQAEIDAEGIEHHASQATLEAMRRMTEETAKPRAEGTR